MVQTVFGRNTPPISTTTTSTRPRTRNARPPTRSFRKENPARATSPTDQVRSTPSQYYGREWSAQDPVRGSFCEAGCLRFVLLRTCSATGPGNKPPHMKRRRYGAEPIKQPAQKVRKQTAYAVLPLFIAVPLVPFVPCGLQCPFRLPETANGAERVLRPAPQGSDYWAWPTVSCAATRMRPPAPSDRPRGPVRRAIPQERPVRLPVTPSSTCGHRCRRRAR